MVKAGRRCLGDVIMHIPFYDAVLRVPAWPILVTGVVFDFISVSV